MTEALFPNIEAVLAEQFVAARELRNKTPLVTKADGAPLTEAEKAQNDRNGGMHDMAKRNLRIVGEVLDVVKLVQEVNADKDKAFGMASSKGDTTPQIAAHNLTQRLAGFDEDGKRITELRSGNLIVPLGGIRGVQVDYTSPSYHLEELKLHLREPNAQVMEDSGKSPDEINRTIALYKAANKELETYSLEAQAAYEKAYKTANPQVELEPKLKEALDVLHPRDAKKDGASVSQPADATKALAGVLPKDWNSLPTTGYENAPPSNSGVANIKDGVYIS